MLIVCDAFGGDSGAPQGPLGDDRSDRRRACSLTGSGGLRAIVYSLLISGRLGGPLLIGGGLCLGGRIAEATAADVTTAAVATAAAVVG